jgi:DNA-binding HxlR family transcriptional regulator
VESHRVACVTKGTFHGWTLLVIRDVVLGNHRYAQLLDRLVAEGILERLRYSERPERFEYQLTQTRARSA